MKLWDDEPLLFGPVIDSWQGDEAFLPDEPHHLIRHRQFLQIPWMMGTNKDDGSFRVQGGCGIMKNVWNMFGGWMDEGGLRMDECIDSG